MRKLHLPESELEIMMVIWSAPGGVDSAYIMERLDKSWVKPTVLNFLSRLCERGFLELTKDGRRNFYRPLISREEYLKSESVSFFEKLHHNSLKSLIASLYDGGALPDEDIEALKSFIEERK